MTWVSGVLVSAMGWMHQTAAAPVRSPLWEPPLQEYFSPLKDFQPAPSSQFTPRAEIVRRTHITTDEFNDLIRKGQPFVVDDCAQGWPYLDWTCEDFAKSYPKGNMKSEYSPGQARQSVGDHKWHQKVRPAKKEDQHISNGQMIAGPYVWHVKDEEPRETKRDIQTRWLPPYFMKNTTVNHREAWDSFEFWFAMPGGGAFAHSDSYNEMTISAQLRGRKVWRLGMYPEVPTIFDSFDSFDTGIYGAGKWEPEYEFEVGPGACFVFPPAYIHETYVQPKDNSECTVATTFQFNVPFPAAYIQSYLHRLMHSHLVWQEGAADLWAPYVQITENEPLPPTDNDGKDIDDRVASILAVVDLNDDGRLTRQELAHFYHEDERSAWTKRSFSWSQQVSAADRKQAAWELSESRVGDVLAWHDEDGDGEISKNELRATTLQWNVLYRKHMALRKLDPSKKKSGKKARKIEMDYLQTYGGCEDPSSESFAQCQESLVKLSARRIPHLSTLSAYQPGEDEEDEEARERHQAGGQEL